MAGDLPDWSQASSNPGQTIYSQQLLAGASITLSTAGYNSMTFRCGGVGAASPWVLNVRWKTDDGLATVVNEQFPACIGDAVSPSLASWETPVYGGLVTITNVFGGPLDLALVASSRTVPAYRMLNDVIPGRLFQGAGVFVAGTAFRLPAVDGGINLFANNAQSWFSCFSNTAGSFLCSYLRRDGVQQYVTMATVAAGASASGFIALPQAMLGMFFNPSAGNAAGAAFIFLNPAQL